MGVFLIAFIVFLSLYFKVRKKYNLLLVRYKKLLEKYYNLKERDKKR